MDELILLPIYPAREEPIEGVTSERILKACPIKKKSLVKAEGLLDLLQDKKPELLVTAGAEVSIVGWSPSEKLWRNGDPSKALQAAQMDTRIVGPPFFFCLPQALSSGLPGNGIQVELKGPTPFQNRESVSQYADILISNSLPINMRVLEKACLYSMA